MNITLILEPDEAAALKTAAVELLQDDAEKLQLHTYRECVMHPDKVAEAEARMISLASVIKKLSRA